MGPIKLIDGRAMIARVEELSRRNQVDIGYVNIVREAVQMQPEAVVHCADCDLARELADTTKPYQHREGAPGWYCEAWGVDVYNGHYSAETYFCAEGRKRAAEEKEA